MLGGAAEGPWRTIARGAETRPTSTGMSGRYITHVARPHPALKRVDAVEDRGESSAFLHLTHKQVRSLPASRARRL